MIVRWIKKYMSGHKHTAYQEYELRDFLTDEFFVRWVKSPTPETSHFWDKWIAQHPEKLAIILKAKQLIHAVGYQHTHEISDQEYTEIYEAVIRQRAVRSFAPSGQSSSGWLLNMAAILLLVLGGAFLYRLYNPPPPPPVEALVWIEKSTPKGTKLAVTLPDGSRVKLNAGSTLKYPETFTGETRQVYLTGEAFFDVAENKEKPFIVQGGEWQAKVLGTSFMIRTHSEKPLVALLTGKLLVKHKEEAPVTLQPLEMAAPAREGKVMVSNFRPEELLAWKEGRLIFKNTPFQEAVATLENWYGVEIQILGGLDVPGGFSGIYDNETLENVLRGLSTTSSVEFDYKINRKEVMLKPIQSKP